MSTKEQCHVSSDYHGRPIPTDETEDTEIVVWEIEPSLDSSYNSEVIRCYHSAVRQAKRVVENLMDDLDQEYPVTITIRQKTMTLREYQELCDD